MDNENSITLSKEDGIKYHLKINKDLIGVGKGYVVVIELTQDQLMQLGKLAMDITSSDIKQLTLKL